MKKLIVGLFVLLPMFAMAAGPSVPLMKAGNDLTDNASLQRGAKLFMNYCLGCHQMQYQRYERTFRDIGIPTAIGEEQLIFDGSKVGSHIKNAIDLDDASKWFGAPPPDLTLVARVRGTDWIYTYLKSFYKDESRPFGVNNVVFPSVGMPHVLQELQGVTTAVTEEVEENGQTVTKIVDIVSDGSGEMSDDEYDQDDDDDVDDSKDRTEGMESILAAAKANQPLFDNTTLDVHYRSRNEDLIAFSNSVFYKGRLKTFPSVTNSNESNWDAVRGSVTSNVLTIESNVADSTACVSWMVVGERQDQHMYDTDWTDDDGKVIVEPEKTEEG